MPRGSRQDIARNAAFWQDAPMTPETEAEQGAEAVAHFAARAKILDEAEVFDVVIVEACTATESNDLCKPKTEICILWKSTPEVHALVEEHMVQQNGYVLMVLTQLGVAFPFGDIAILAGGLTPNFIRKIFAKLLAKADIWTFDNSPEFRAVVEKHKLLKGNKA
jgi:hypothetical protein